MRKLWLTVWLALAFVCLSGQAYALEVSCPIYFNGKLGEIRALAVDGVSYLPLRDMAEVLAADIQWRPEEKRVDLDFGGDRYRIWPGRTRFAYEARYDEGAQWEEGELSNKPLLRQGRVWLPLDIVSRVAGAEIYWEPGKRAVCIDGIPVWQQGEWNLPAGNGTDQEPTVDAQGNRWLVVRNGELTMGVAQVWWLGPEGKKLRQARDWEIEILAVDSHGPGKCYFMTSSMSGPSRFWQAEAGKAAERLGREDMYYGYRIAEYYDTYRMVSHEADKPDTLGWRLAEQGLVAYGVPLAAKQDFYNVDGELAREGYGIYRLSPGGQELVEKLELPEKRTVAEQLREQKEMWQEGREWEHWRQHFIGTRVWVNGEPHKFMLGESSDMWEDTEPYLRLRDVAEIVGCQVGWSEASKQITVTAGERQDSIDPATGKGVRTVGGQRQEYNVGIVEYSGVNYVSWRFFEGLNGAKVSWDEEANRVDIITK